MSHNWIGFLFQDHQALLSEAHDVEVKKLKKEEHLERVLLDLFPTKEEAKAIRVKNEVDEAAGILYSDDESDDQLNDMDSLVTGETSIEQIPLYCQNIIR